MNMDNGSNIVSDKIVVEKILSGDTQTFAIVVKNTERLVAQIVRKMIVNEEDQKDIVQDIYFKAYQNIGSFKFQSKLSTWIGTIAYNSSVNYLEKRKIRIYDIDSLNENHLADLDTIENTTLKIETNQILRMEIDKLPAIYRTLIMLYYIEELPNKEIAEITNLPEGTIKSYLFRARRILKVSIEKNHKNDILW